MCEDMIQIFGRGVKLLDGISNTRAVNLAEVQFGFLTIWMAKKWRRIAL
jgi:hypothetical protein